MVRFCRFSSDSSLCLIRSVWNESYTCHVNYGWKNQRQRYLVSILDPQRAVAKTESMTKFQAVQGTIFVSTIHSAGIPWVWLLVWTSFLTLGSNKSTVVGLTNILVYALFRSIGHIQKAAFGKMIYFCNCYQNYCSLLHQYIIKQTIVEKKKKITIVIASGCLDEPSSQD